MFVTRSLVKWIFVCLALFRALQRFQSVREKTLHQEFRAEGLSAKFIWSHEAANSLVVATNRRVVLGADDSADVRAAFHGLEGPDRAQNAVVTGVTSANDPRAEASNGNLREITALVRIRNRGVAVLTAGCSAAVLQDRRADAWAGERRAPPPGAGIRADERRAVVVGVNAVRQGRGEDRAVQASSEHADV